MKKIFLLSLIVLFSIFLSGCTFDFSDKTENSLKEKDKQIENLKTEISNQTDFDLKTKCYELSTKHVNAEWKNSPGVEKLDYSIHYNKLLNKCFLFVEMDVNEIIDGVKKLTSYKFLYEPQENLMLGSLKINNPDFECEVSNIKCDSIGDFEKKIKYFME